MVKLLNLHWFVFVCLNNNENQERESIDGVVTLILFGIARVVCLLIERDVLRKHGRSKRGRRCRRCALHGSMGGEVRGAAVACFNYERTGQEGSFPAGIQFAVKQWTSSGPGCAINRFEPNLNFISRNSRPCLCRMNERHVPSPLHKNKP